MKNEITNIIGNNIRLLRRERKITQGDLARATGIVLQQISKYERGATAPGSKNLSKIAKALGVSVSELTGDAPPIVAEAQPAYSGADTPLSTLRQLAIEELSRMTDEELEQFVVNRLQGKHRSKTSGD